MNKDAVIDEPIQEEDHCARCSKKDTACISFFAHENAMMHKDTDNERAHRTTLFVCITFVIITVIFVFAYTVRMNSFLNTINQLTADIVELAGAKGVIAP
jgi:preprotein translocase subunit SecG